MSAKPRVVILSTFLTPYRSGDDTRWTWRQTVDNSEHGTIMSLAVGLGLMLLREWLRGRGVLL